MENSLVLLSLRGDLLLMFLQHVLALAMPLAFYVIFLYIKRDFILCRSMVDGPKRYPVVGSLFAFWKNRSRQSEWYAEMLAMGRMDAIWGADCLQFKPERWLNEDGHFVPQSPFKFAVFQGGSRICLGKDMAFIQMKYVAATVVSMFRLRRAVQYSAVENPKLIHSLTARMKGGFPVLVEKKKVDQ